MNMQVLTIIIVVAIAAAAILGWLYATKRHTDRLRERFGPEYDAALSKAGDRRRAEAELRARARRVEQLHIRHLDQEESVRFAERWRAVQARFVDDPRGAVAQANALVKELMQSRGYPIGDFDQRAADISVDHPHLVENYRAAREIAQRSEGGAADTDELRTAFMHYRRLFEELLETPELVETR